MNSRLIFILALLFFLTGCSFFNGDKDNKSVVADGLTPKELYEQAEDQINAGSIDAAIDKFKLI